MPNYWSDPKPIILNAHPHFINGYGFLYTFDCEYDGRKFTQMSRIFVPKEINRDPIGIHQHFKDMKGKIGINPITSLNRKKGRTEEVVIENAKAYADKKSEDMRKAKERREKEETEREEPADPEWVSNLIRQKMKELEEKNKKASYDWYNNAKKFVKSISGNNKLDFS